MCVRINKGDAKRLLKNGKRRVNHSLPVQKNNNNRYRSGNLQSAVAFLQQQQNQLIAKVNIEDVNIQFALI